MNRAISFLVVLFVMIGVVTCFSDTDAYAAQEDGMKIPFGIETIDVSEEIYEYIEQNLDIIAHEIEVNGDSFGYEKYFPDATYILKPFQIYDIDENGGYTNKTSGILYFPVYSGNRLIFMIQLVREPSGKLNYSESNWLVEELTPYMQDNRCRKIYASYWGEERIPKIHIIETECEHDDSVLFNLKNILSDHRSIQTNETPSLFKNPPIRLMNSPYITSYCPTNGFSINQSNLKRLNMNFCLVNDPAMDYGTPVPCMATIYRYRTATYSLACAELVQINNNRPGGPFNYTLTSGQVGLLNYLMPVSTSNLYHVHNSVVTYYNVLHNINNAFPILIGGTDSNAVTNRCFVIEGYDYTSSAMKLYVFDPRRPSNAGVTVLTNSFSNGSPVTFSSMNYTWHQSGNSCLIP